MFGRGPSPQGESPSEIGLLGEIYELRRLHYSSVLALAMGASFCFQTSPREREQWIVQDA